MLHEGINHGDMDKADFCGNQYPWQIIDQNIFFYQLTHRTPLPYFLGCG
jgi:hypothetical protein